MACLEERNKRITDAIAAKADAVCPGALAMIGIYGSFMTGDFHEKSDLDLLVLINDDRGRQLGCTFIQDDLQIGHDIYCTTWESLRHDALYEHPNISKLMDSEIIYCADEKYKHELEALRTQVKDILSAPMSAKDFTKAEKLLKEAEHYYTMAEFSEEKSEVTGYAADAVDYIENAMAMLNKRYFHFGMKRAYEELEAMQNKPENLAQLIENVVSATSVAAVKEHLKLLIKESAAAFERVRGSLRLPKAAVSEGTIGGTYEEMFSNWRNKMYLAAQTGNKHLAFMSMAGLSRMLHEIYNEVEISSYDVMCAYDSQDLHKTAKAYDDITNAYLQEYIKAGIQVKRFGDIDAFIRDYIK